MKLKRPITIKAIVTEDFKAQVKDELTKTISRIEAASQQLDMNLRRYVPELAKTDLNQASRLRQEIEAERQKQDSAKTELAERLKEITDLEIGDEFMQGQIEGEVEIQVGDNLFDKIGDAEIVVKDGIVQEIRG
jgi:septal ring factor EnvC (AmiA/AmiB activator)